MKDVSSFAFLLVVCCSLFVVPGDAYTMMDRTLPTPSLGFCCPPSFLTCVFLYFLLFRPCRSFPPHSFLYMLRKHHRLKHTFCYL